MLCTWIVVLKGEEYIDINTNESVKRLQCAASNASSSSGNSDGASSPASASVIAVYALSHLAVDVLSVIQAGAWELTAMYVRACVVVVMVVVVVGFCVQMGKGWGPALFLPVLFF